MSKDGGPAFPHHREWENERKGYTESESSDGMSLRDYFAAAALQGMLASDPVADRSKVNKRVWAKVAYSFADAMLEERLAGDVKADK